MSQCLHRPSNGEARSGASQKREAEGPGGTFRFLAHSSFLYSPGGGCGAACSAATVGFVGVLMRMP